MPDAYLERTREFFGIRAATWDTRFGHDMPVYAAAIAEAGIRRAGVAVDAGCGTGRALPALRDAVGPDGTVIGLEVTPQMLAEARSKGWAASATLLVLGDARALPFAGASVDAVFAAGLVHHLPDPRAGLAELGPGHPAGRDPRALPPGWPGGARRPARPDHLPRRDPLPGTAARRDHGHGVGAGRL